MEQPDSQAMEYAAAFKTIRCAKNLFIFLVLAAIVVQLASFVMVEFVGVADEMYAASTAGGVETKPAEASPNGWVELMHWLLPGVKFVAVVAAAILSLTLLVGLKISLVGRLGGAAGLVSAFFWSLILLAMVTPWQKVLNSSFACGALYNYGHLAGEAAKIKPSWGAAGVGLVDKILYYARFIAYPVLAVFVLLIVQVKWSRGFSQMISPPKQQPQRPSEPPAEQPEQ